MSKNIYFPFGARVVRDTYVNQVTPPQPEPVKETPKEEIKKEPKVEVKMSGEPSLEVIQETPKTTKVKKSTPPQDITNEEA